MADTKEKLKALVKGAIHSWESNVNMSDHITDHLIANGVTIPEWIPVTERLPEHRGDVIVVAKGKTMVGWYAITSNVWHILTPDGFSPCDHVTHWMPLPEPPKEECG